MSTPGDGASSCRLVLLVLREVVSIYDRKVVNSFFGSILAGVVIPKLPDKQKKTSNSFSFSFC